MSINLVESSFSASRSRFRYRTWNTAITSRKRKVGGGKGTKGTVEGEKEIQLILRLRQRRARRKSARYRASSSDKANRVSCYEISLALNPFSFLGIESTCRGQVHGGIRHTNTNGLGTRILSGEWETLARKNDLKRCEKNVGEGRLSTARSCETEFSERYTLIYNGKRMEKLFSSPERRVLRGMINEGRKIAGVKPLTFKVYGKRTKNERRNREDSV